MPDTPIIPGAEPFAAARGSNGALVLHGFTGTPQSMRGLAEALAAAGFTVDLPRLPGHGTSVEDMITTGWDDWSAAAEAAYEKLAANCERVVVAGLSMGGTLTAWLASRHPEIEGIALINPQIARLAPEVRQILDLMVAQGVPEIPAIGSDIAQPGVTELAYDRTPVSCVVALMQALESLSDDWAKISCPVLIMTSPQDHVVPNESSDLLASTVKGPVERITLARSFHVATLDYDAGLIEQETVAFARRVTGG